MCLVTAMRPGQHRAIPDTPRPKLLLSSAMSALAARGPFASPFHCGGGRLERLRTAKHRRFRWSAPVWSPPGGSTSKGNRSSGRERQVLPRCPTLDVAD
jgi:hypothetical protein